MAQREPSGATRRRILDVALELFLEQGYDRTSLREIAERLGFSKAALYYHYKAKDDILQALADALLADLRDDRPWDRQRSSVSPFAYLRRGRYAEQLEPWSTTFPSTTHVLFTEELLADPAVLTGLVADLGLDPGRTPVPDDEVVNATPGVEPVLDPGVTNTLEGYFEESNARLADQLGRTLPW
jgi:AcrR family transcriptional regulator